MKVKFRNLMLLPAILLTFLCLVGCQPKVNQDQIMDVTNTGSQGESSGDKDIGVNEAIVFSDVSDTDILKIMGGYGFFIGDVLIDEEQKWQSKYQDASHGEGNAKLAVKELIAYDPATQKAYIIVRTLKYESQHMVTVNDIQGNFSGRSPISASGELIECYGLGQYNDGVLDFTGLPIRMDQVETNFYTRPATHNSQWVAYRSIGDSVRWSIERIGPPEYAVDAQLHQLATIDTVTNTKTYGNRESAMYEATNRLWQVKGTVDYRYTKIDHLKALDYLKTQIRELELANSYVSPSGLASLGSDYSKLWEALDQLAGYSHQAIRAGQSILFMPVTYPEAVAQVNRDRLNQALAQMSDIGKQSPIFGLLPEGQGFAADLEARVVAQKSAKEIYIAPFLGYLQRYEEAVQSLMVLPENERTPNAQKAVLKTLLAQGFSAEGTQALDMAGQVPMPDGYPLEILPVPKDGRLVMAETIEDGGFNLTYIDLTPEAKIIEKYVVLLSAHPEYTKITIQGMTMITANKAPWSISVTIGKNQLTEEGGMMVNITLVPLEE